MTTYHKVSRRDVSKETDLVVTLIESVAGPCAFLSDPAVSRDTPPMPVPEALSSAEQLIAGDLNARELVIIDEDELWNDDWGTLTPHPDRRTIA
jgi:hypothetical protein